jgi:hypothetical protein
MTPVLAEPRHAEMAAALLGVASWQKTISDNPYNTNAGEGRLRAQQRLAAAALTSAAETVSVILAQAGGHIPETALDSMPTLGQPIMAHEIVNPNWHTDSTLHASLGAAGCARNETMEFAWWHLLTLKLLVDGKLPDPPTFLLGLQVPASLPFDRASLDATHGEVSPQERKGIDTAIRRLIRHSGGIWHRRGRWLVDAPLPAAWWRIELAKAASAAAPDDICPEVAYDALRSAWRLWAESAARNSTRLAAPNCVAAYVLAATRHNCRLGAPPAGAAAKQLIANLMRRTQQLSVSHVNPLELARLAI